LFWSIATPPLLSSLTHAIIASSGAGFLGRLTISAVHPSVFSTQGIETFLRWDASLVRNSDYLCLRNDERFDFLDGHVVDSDGERISEERFKEHLQYVRIPHSHAEGYRFSGTQEDYLVGSLARLNLNADVLHPRTRADAADAVSVFPSDNVYHNNLAQAIEILQCVDDAMVILEGFEIGEEKPVRGATLAGWGASLIEAPRGLLYHSATVDAAGIVEDYDLVVPTAQNQINIENDLRYHFQRNLN
jgi:sulfhydrogenase subunit alpha